MAIDRMKMGLATAAAIVFVVALAAAPTDTGAAENAVTAQNGTVDPLQVARGAKAWASTCGRCHNLRSPKEFSDKNWDVIVNHMQVIAPIPGQIARDIKAFLKASN